MNSGGDDRYACPGLVPDGSDAYPCGLWLGHAGACTPNVGDYLPPPMLHPLDARLVAVRGRVDGVLCPNGHGGAWSSPFPGRRWWMEPSVSVVGPVMPLRHWEDGGWVASAPEMAWRFLPCECEFRQIVQSPGV